jgi:hypothetical protein
MKPPICKVCGSPHWLDEGHKPTSALEETRKLGADVLGYEKRFPVFHDQNPPETEGPLVYVPANVPTETVVPTPDVPTCECGKPREGRYKKCSACRKRAYRGRRSR